MKKNKKAHIIAVILVLIAIFSVAVFYFNGKKNDVVEYELFTPIVGNLKSEVVGSGVVIPYDFENNNYDNLEFQMEVNEVDIPKIEENMIAVITLNAFENKIFKGMVSEISDEGDVENDIATFKVTIDMNEKLEKMKSGMTGYAAIITEVRQNVIYIPIEGLYTEGENKYVLIKAGENTEKVYVETGISNDEYIEIKSGLTEENEIQLPIEKDINYVNRFVPRVFQG